MCGFIGAAAFTAVFGVLVTKVGYSPLFVVLAILDLIAAVIILSVARAIPQEPEPQAPGTTQPGHGSLLPV